MKIVTQKARFRQTVINYAEKYGVTKGANRYDVTRQYIYRWKKRMKERSSRLWTNLISHIVTQISIQNKN